MTTGESEPTGDRAGREVILLLAGANPEERTELVRGLIASHPQGRLELSGGDDERVVLDGVDFGAISPGGALKGVVLRRASLRKARLRGVDLRGADFAGAALGEADLGEALLEKANLERADLAGASLRGASLGAVNLRDALLEEADLRGAAMRFADLRGAALENADLRGADLWGALLQDADLTGADLREVVFREADLRGANLTRTKLEGATLVKVNLEGVNLKDAILPGVVLSTCNLAGVRFGGTWLEKTRMRREQLGDEIGEEAAGDYDGAAQGYLALERNFAGLGDADAEGWAYRRRRRMQKWAAGRKANAALGERRWGIAGGHLSRFLSDQFVEWLCDYGESVPRVFASLLVLHLAFTLVYGLTDSVVRLRERPGGVVEKIPTRGVVDLMTFSLMAMSTSGSPSVGLQPRDESVHFLTAAEALSGIAMTGLLGFVVGNRIRR